MTELEFSELISKQTLNSDVFNRFSAMNEMDLQSLYFIQYSPLLKSFDDIEKIPELLEDNEVSDYCFYFDFHPEFVAECCKYGYFPMAFEIFNIPLLSIKHHKYKCIITFDELHIPSNVKKLVKNKFRNLRITFNRAFDLCIENIHNIHGENWLYKPLVNSFRTIHNSDNYSVSVNSVEIWDDNKLVAGEIGFITGNVYVSLSGFYIVENMGTIQMSALGLFLKNNGFAFWDLGMSIEYKYRYGARDFNRAEQQQIYSGISKKLSKLPENDIWVTELFYR